MQTKQMMEEFYSTPDPWGYKNHEEDEKRRNKIIETAKKYRPKYRRALDLGCGEGFITEKLPARYIYGYDLSETAMSRLPENVRKADPIEGMYDLIIATGVMYIEYDYQQMLDAIKSHAKGIVILSNIKNLQVQAVEQLGEPIYEEEYPYREYTQSLKVYDFSRKQ